MYIQEARITQFGILKNQDMLNLPHSLIVIHGANEAGKSTLLNFFRCMIADIPQRRNNEHYKAIPTIDLGFSGKIRVMPSSLDNGYLEIYKKYSADSKKKPTVTLSDSFGKSIDMAFWRHILGNAVDISVYKNIFGISLSELTAITEENINDALYGASIGLSSLSPRKVLDLLDSQSSKLYKAKGQNQTINRLLVDLARVEEERYACLAIMEQYESLQTRSKLLFERIHNLDEEIKSIHETISTYKKIESSWESYKEAIILEEELQQLPASSHFTKSLKVDFEQFYREKENAKEQSIIFRKKIETLEAESASVLVDETILKKMHQIYALSEKKSQYQSMQENLQKNKRKIESIHESIEAILSELGTEWNNDKIQKIDTSFAVEKEISKKEQLLHEHDAGVYHKTQTLEDIQNACKILEKELSSNDKENEYVAELFSLEEHIENLQIKCQEKKYTEREIASIEESIRRDIEAVCPTWTVAEAEKCSLGAEEVIAFRSLAELHATYAKKWDELEEKIRRSESKCTNYIEDIEKTKELLDQYEEGNTTKDIETMSLLENLLYVKEQVSTAQELSGKVRTFIWMPLIVAVLFIGVYFLYPQTTIFSSIIIGISALVSFFSAYFMYTITNSIKKHLLSLELEEVKNVSTLISEIRICSECLGLENIKRGTIERKKALLLENREINNHYKFYKEHEGTLNKLLSQQIEEQNILLEEIKNEEIKMREVKYKWKQRLEALFMPVFLEISVDAFQKFSESLKNIKDRMKQRALSQEDLNRIKFMSNDIRRIIKESAFYKSISHLFEGNEGDYTYFLQEMKKQIKYLQDIARNKWIKEQEYKKLLREIEILKESIPDMKDTSLAVTDWRAWLKSHGYPEDSTPEIVREYIKQIRKIKEYNKALDVLLKEEEEIRYFIKEFDAELHIYIAILPYSKKEELRYKDSLTSLEHLFIYLKNEEEKYRKKNELLEKKQELSSELLLVEESTKRILEKIQHIFDATNTSSIEELRNAFDFFEKYNEKKDRIEHLYQIVKSIVHPLTIQEVEKYFSTLSFEELEEHIQKEQERISILDAERVSLAKECGTLENQIIQAEKGGINTHNINYAMLTTEIEKYTKEWMQVRIAKEIIIQAKKHLEEHKQPRVMEMASLFMNEITEGSWNRILRSTENDILLSNSKGERSSPERLSRGTQEQAYFSLRLAGACNHALITKEPLPLLLDDVTVNFDPKRARKMAKLLTSITNGSLPTIPQHQVFLFTCHSSVVDMFKDTIPEAKFFSLKAGYLTPLELYA